MIGQKAEISDWSCACRDVCLIGQSSIGALHILLLLVNVFKVKPVIRVLVNCIKAATWMVDFYYFSLVFRWFVCPFFFGGCCSPSLSLKKYVYVFSSLELCSSQLVWWSSIQLVFFPTCFLAMCSWEKNLLWWKTAMLKTLTSVCVWLLPWELRWRSYFCKPVFAADCFFYKGLDRFWCTCAS